MRSLLATAVVVALLVSGCVLSNRGWIPHDDGYLAHTAERVVSGDIPHRDFDEIYTGGLAFLNAAAFEAWGTKLSTLRIPLLGLLYLSLIMAYALFRRELSFSESLLGIIVVFLTGPILIGTPTPNAYTVALAIIACSFVAKFFESESKKYLLIGGAVVGLSMLIKTAAVYVALAIGLAIVGWVNRRRAMGPDVLGRGLIVLGLGLTAALVFSAPSGSRVAIFLLPTAVLAAMTWTTRPRCDASALAPPSSLRTLAPFVVGMLMPLIAFATFMWSKDAFGDLVMGLISIPQIFLRHFVGGDFSAFSIVFPMALVIMGAILANISATTALPAGLVAVAGMLVWYAINPRSFLLAAVLGIGWLPALAVVGLMYLRFKRRDSDLTVLVVAGAMAISFIRIPTSNQYYILNAAPMAVAATLIVAGGFKTETRRVLIAGLAGIAVILGLAAYEGRIFSAGEIGQATPHVWLDSDRGQIWVPNPHGFYNALARRHYTQPAISGPDEPLPYFLYSLGNHSRVIFPLISPRHPGGLTFKQQLLFQNPATVIYSEAAPTPISRDGVLLLLDRACSARSREGYIEIFSNCEFAQTVATHRLNVHASVDRSAIR